MISMRISADLDTVPASAMNPFFCLHSPSTVLNGAGEGIPGADKALGVVDNWRVYSKAPSSQLGFQTHICVTMQPKK